MNEYNRYWKESKDKDLKMMLREISRSCEGDGHPDVKLTFKMENKGEVVMEINRWCGVVQYFMFQRSMEHGFRYHIVVGVDSVSQTQEGQLLQDIFAPYLTIHSRPSRASSEKAEVSQGKRRLVALSGCVGAAIKSDREKHERQLQAYETMCLDNL